MSLYNEDELVAPKWVDQDFLEKVLSKYENDEDVKVVKFDISPASMKGDHYASVMYRIKVEYKFSTNGPSLTKSLILKTLPDEGQKRDMLMESKIFETEIGVYINTIPAMEEILAQHGDTTRIGPKVIYHSVNPNKVIIMEDLCELGYNPIRGRYLNEDEIKAVYTKLAKFHAVSFMLGKSEKHELVTTYQEGIFNDSMAVTHDMIAGGITKFIEMLSTHDEFDYYLPKFKAIEKELLKDCQRLYRAYENGAKDEIFVLNHGDFHMKNLMFKFGKKSAMDDFLFVHFQISVFAPSVIDLIYSTYMLLSPELRHNKRNSLYHFYFEHFIATLKRIKYAGEMPKFADFQIATIKYRHFSIFMLSTFMPLVITLLSQTPEQMKDKKSPNFFEDVDMTAMLYRSPALIEEARKMLPIFLNAGFLD